MRKFAGVAAVVALAFAATVVMAASPSPSASPSASARPATPSAKPSASPSATPSASPSASPSATPSTSSSAAATTDWTTSVAPVDITGSVKVHEFKSGGGIVTFKLDDLLDQTAWSIRIDRGFFEGPATRTLIAARSGDNVQHFLRDTLSIHLTKTEMSAFRAALKKTGVVVFISDGTRLSVAKFPPM